MAQNLQIDPVKRDYVVTNGSPVPSDRVLEACYYAMLIPENWMYAAPGQGSLLYTLNGIKRSTTIEQQFAAYTQDALNRQVIQTGKATNTQVTNIAANAYNSSNQVQAVPSLVQLATQYTFLGV